VLKKVYFVFIFSLSLLNISAQDSKLDLVFEDLIPIEFYTQLQFPQCSSDPSFSNFQIEQDYAGTVNDFTNISDHKILERQSKKLRDFQQQIIKLNRKQEYAKVIEVSEEAISFVNDSLIFKQRFLRGYDHRLLGFYSLRGYQIDFLSALQYTTLSIINASYEAAKALGNKESVKEWAETGFKVNRWIYKYRGCSNNLFTKFYLSPKQENQRFKQRPLCSLNGLTESIFSESLALDAMNRKDYKNTVNLASQSLSAIQVTPESQISFQSAAVQRLNNLARLAYSANLDKNWCLSFEGFDRAIKLASEIDIQPLEIWKTLKLNASEHYFPSEISRWNEKYGMAAKEDTPSYIPIKQIPPKYPGRLMSKGIEGCVMLSFDITKGGKTKNVEVVWSTHSGFERPARMAGKEFIFSPPYKGGVLSEIEGHRSVLIFKMNSKDKLPGYIPPGCESNEPNSQDL
jgi:TonB family protein